MKEEVFHFIWQHGLFNKDELKTLDDESVKIIHPGTLNSNSGPDFIQAKIFIDNVLFIGNVELHLIGQDWYKHQHETDAAYQNVILHVVLNDAIPTKVLNRNIPTVEIGNRVEKAFTRNYTYLLQHQNRFACEKLCANIPSKIIEEQWEWAGKQRIIQKSKKLHELFLQTGNRIDQAFLILLTRNFGFGINNEIAQMLGTRLPIKLVYKYMHSQFQLEALILGLSGLLEKETSDEYFLELEKEFRYLKQQFQLIPLPAHAWKFSKTRPGNFPTIRLAQLAALLHQKPRLIPQIFEAKNLKDLMNIFESEISPYWQNHYAPGKFKAQRQLQLSKEGIYNIIINSVIPLWVWEGFRSEVSLFLDRSEALLKEMPFENNKYTRIFEALNPPKKNAFHSQAAYYQAKELCEKKQCLHCKIGQNILHPKAEITSAF